MAHRISVCGIYNSEYTLYKSRLRKKFLERYCRDHGMTAYRHYDEDDGYSGTNFNRTCFQRMLDDIKAGRIKRVIVKDYCAIIGLNQKGLENQGILA